MTTENSYSSIELSIGQNDLRIEGSEEFISQELSTILDRVDLTEQQNGIGESGSEPEQVTLDDVDRNGDSSTEESNSSNSETNTRLAEVADSLNVKTDSLTKHFFLDGDDIHIQDPMNIEPKYALLGYCIIREEMTGDKYHENTATKEKLIDGEKVNIEEWGSSFLYNLRRSGYIRDDPNSKKGRNKPFKITPSGHKEFVQWLNEDD